jgi:cytosine/adenosine deaminase-related metal-dependent hydrolase
MPSRQILHARYILPVVGEPIENGFVAIEGSRITAIGKNPPSGEILDLGNAAVLPGLINVHTHLELSGFSRPLGEEGMNFVDWIRQIIDHRQSFPIDFDAAISAGLRECSKEGVTTVGNISQLAETDAAYENAPASGIRFLELIAPTAERTPAVLDFLKTEFPKQLQAAGEKTWSLGLSPHAPYSVHPDLLKAAVDVSTEQKVPLAMHLAESCEEMQLLQEGTGPFRDFLTERNLFDPATFPGGKRPLDYLQILARAWKTLVVHGNYLNDEEIAFLAERRDRMAVVYCPRTHAYFRHEPYPLEKVLSAGATVCLGTDSRASSPDLSLLAEMRFVAERFPRLDRSRIMCLATIDAARALGRAEEIGSLEAGKIANLAVVSLPEGKSDDPCRLLLESTGPVLQTWFHGRRI